jgi:hypothetical protein
VPQWVVGLDEAQHRVLARNQTGSLNIVEDDVGAAFRAAAHQKRTAVQRDFSLVARRERR